MRSLFDVNVLIALLDPDHSHHERAQVWWQDELRSGWASCPITENGFVRILSTLKYQTDITFTPAQLVADLSDFVSMSDHEFWPDHLSLLDESSFVRGRLISARSLTDVYLLGLAVEHEARLVTFDKRISRDAVVKAKEDNLCVI